MISIKRKTSIGILIIIIDGFVFYYRSDILTELFKGRPLSELDIYKLLLPVILLLIGLFLIFNNLKTKKNDTPENDDTSSFDTAFCKPNRACPGA